MAERSQIELVQFTADNLASVYETGVIEGAFSFSMQARCWRIFATSFQEARTLPDQELAEKLAETGIESLVMEDVRDRYTMNRVGRGIVEIERQGLRARALAILAVSTGGKYFYPDYLDKQFAGSGPVKLF